MKTLMVALASRISVSLFLPVDMESDFSSSNINVCICGAQKGSSKDEGVFMSSYMSSTMKSTSTKKFIIFMGIFSAIPTG
jgi:hypothetical protein